MNSCLQCQSSFQVTEKDRAFYVKIGVPEPTLCPECRLQRRLSFRNEQYLFKRVCDLCKKAIISFHEPVTPFPVYCSECWWSDRWDALSYGRDYDFSRPFFEQFKDLMMKVPKAGMLQLGNENCDYNSYIAYSKNSYMSPGCYFLENCYYLRKSQYNKDCLDCLLIDHSELLRACVNCAYCYNSHDLLNCKNCSDSAYLADSTGCKNCFMCSGLSNKTFHYKNKAYSENDYKKIIETEMQRDPQELMEEFLKFNQSVPKKYQNQLNCQESSGDYIQSCKNATECYDCFNVEDSKYLTESVGVKDSMDLNMHDKDIELCYELSSGGESNQRLKFSFCGCASPNSDYLYACLYLSDSFGCDSINKKNKFCILNKKYTEPEYRSLRKKIIAHMMSTQEYGEFFPMTLSLHPYNETVAHTNFPLTEEKAIAQGLKWRNKDPAHYKSSNLKIPLKITDTPDSILREILACERCGKNYKIIEQELKLCRRLSLPLSPLCAECRQANLMALKNPRKLWNRTCSQCQKSIETTYSPERMEKVYCEECYLKEVY